MTISWVLTGRGHHGKPKDRSKASGRSAAGRLLLFAPPPSPGQKRRQHPNTRQHLPLGRRVERIARDLELEPPADPPAFEVQRVVLLFLHVMHGHGIRFIARSRPEWIGQGGQLVPRIHHIVHQLGRETPVVARRPHEDDEQRNDDEEPPLKAVRSPDRPPRSLRFRPGVALLVEYYQ